MKNISECNVVKWKKIFFMYLNTSFEDNHKQMHLLHSQCIGNLDCSSLRQLN